MHDVMNVTTEVLQAFADAWNRHDADALMSFMAEDCAFEASAESKFAEPRSSRNCRTLVMSDRTSATRLHHSDVGVRHVRPAPVRGTASFAAIRPKHK